MDLIGCRTMSNNYRKLYRSYGLKDKPEASIIVLVVVMLGGSVLLYGLVGLAGMVYR